MARALLWVQRVGLLAAPDPLRVDVALAVTDLPVVAAKE